MNIVRRFLWMEPFWVLMLGIPIMLPGRFLPAAMQPYVVLALLLFWPVRWFCAQARNKHLRSEDTVGQLTFSPLTLPFFCLLGWLPVNLWSSADWQMSWVAVGYLLFGMALYAAFIHWPPVQQNPLTMALLLLLIGSSIAISTPPLVVWKPDFRLFHLPLYNRLQAIHLNLGETIHANVLAGILVLLLPLFIALLFQPNWTSLRWLRWLCGLFTLIVGGLLILTQSRGGYLAVAVAFPLVFLLRWPRLRYLLPLLLLGLLFSTRFIQLQPLLDQFSSDGSLGGWDVRLDIWTHSLHALTDFVYTGIGIGTFTLVMPLLYPLRYPIEGYPHAHNLLLQVGVDLGLPGLIAYLALLINLFAMLITVLRARHATHCQRTLAIGATGSLTALLVHGLLDAVTWGTKLAFIPWLLFALITLLFLEVEKCKQPH